MQKNTFMFVLCTTVFLIIWFMFFQPKQDAQLIVENPVNSQQNQEIANNNQNLNINSKETVPKQEVISNIQNIPEEEITIETDKYKAVFSNKGAAIKHWYIKEQNNALVDLVLPEASPVLANFPGSVYEIVEKTDRKSVV